MPRRCCVVPAVARCTRFASHMPWHLPGVDGACIMLYPGSSAPVCQGCGCFLHSSPSFASTAPWTNLCLFQAFALDLSPRILHPSTHPLHNYPSSRDVIIRAFTRACACCFGMFCGPCLLQPCQLALCVAVPGLLRLPRPHCSHSLHPYVPEANQPCIACIFVEVSLLCKARALVGLTLCMAACMCCCAHACHCITDVVQLQPWHTFSCALLNPAYPTYHVA